MPTLNIPKNSTLHTKILTRIVSRIKIARTEQNKHHKRWRDAEERMVAYLPESTADSIRRQRREGGEPQYTTIQVPYTFAMVMTAHTYWTSVFFGRNPVHQFAGRHGQGEMQVQALEALIQYQVDVGGMLAPYYLWLYDAAKYGVGVLGTYWDRKIIQYGSLEPGMDGSVSHVSRAIAGYTGNCGFNVSPFDFLWDPRVQLGQFQKGEFCAQQVRIGAAELRRRRDTGEYMNVDQMPDGPTKSGEGDGETSSSRVERPQDDYSMQLEDWDAKQGKKRIPARARLYEFYVELSPREWGVGQAESTEKWVFTITADLALIIGAQPLGAMHGQFPFDVIEPELEAYGTVNRGLPEMLDPLQRTMDWLLNTHMYNVRASLYNQFIFDPTRLETKDFQRSGPGKAIRVRREAYGQDVRTMFHQLDVRDVTQAHMGDMGSIFSIGERMFGINDQMMGMIAPAGGSRRTATEVRSATGFGVNRQKTQTEWISASAFAPHAQKLLMTSQQYYDGNMKFRIVGDMALMAGEPFINVTPDLIAGQFDVVPVDGTLPVDRFAQVTMWKDLLSSLTSNPIMLQQLMQFDMGKILGWVFSLGGIKNINQFKVQVLPPGMGPSPGAMPMMGPGAEAPGMGLSGVMAGASGLESGLAGTETMGSA